MLARRTLSATSLPLSAARLCATQPVADTIGNIANGVRPTTASACRLRDIVGATAGAGGGTCVSSRMPAGDLLSLIDICAARASSKHVFGKFTMGLEGDRTASVATVAMDNLIFKQPVMFGDVIDLQGTVVDVGNSSIAVNVDVNRIQFSSKQRQPVANATVFMVAVDQRLRAAPIVPALKFESTDAAEVERLKRLNVGVHEARGYMKKYKALRKELDELEVAAIAERTPALFEADPTKRYLVRIPETEHVVNRLFFPSHLNLNNTVFGGELLRWMEANAVHCGRMFTGSRNIFTIGMHAIEFHEPVYKSDWMRLECHVVYVKRTTMEVDVRVTAERDGKQVTTNRANFVLTSLDEAGKPLEVLCGLDVRRDEPAYWVRRHAVAAQRYQWLKRTPAFPNPQ